MGSKKSVAIVGGGLTGLTAAWRLKAAGFEVKVFEKSQLVGGRTMSVRKAGYIFDTGAITLLPTYANTCALIDELGIGKNLHRIAPVIGIPRDGKIHRLDLAKPVRSLLGTQLISWRAKFRLLKLLLPMIRTWNLSNFQTLSPLAAWDHETIADYVRRELGEEIHEYIVGPIIRGNTLNSTASAPAGELLWMLRQYAAPFVSGLDQGINFLAETLGARLPVQFNSEVLAVEKNGQYVTLRGQHNGALFTESFDACVLALPPKELLALAPSLSTGQRNFLTSIRPLCSVNLHVGLRRRPASTETFILPPESEHKVLTTIVMDHNKAPGRAPAGKGVVSFFLSDVWCEQNIHRLDAELLAEVLEMAKPFIGDVSADVETYVVQRWPYAIIKSSIGLYHRIAEYEAGVDAQDRVQLGGDFLSMGMEAAVSSGTRAAENLKTLLTQAH